MSKTLVIVGGILILIIVVIGIVVISNSSSNNNSSTQNSTSNTTNNSNSSSSTAGRCIITVNGSQYDLTEFKKIHEGGDIFICGTDMTSRFRGEHGNDFARLEPYKVK